MKDLLLMLIPAIAGFLSCYLFRRQDYEAGRIAGANEERSWRNRIVIRAKYTARADGIIYGCENHAALMSRRQGNVSGIPFPKNHEVTPPSLPHASARYAEEVGLQNSTARGSSPSEDAASYIPGATA